MKKTLVIAEAGVNHNGKLDLAYKLADIAKEAGADIVKYQTFVARDTVSINAEKAAYQIENTKNSDESQLEMIKKLELTFDEFVKVIEHCNNIGIKFLSTPFDFKSIDFLNKIGLDIFKIPSGEITNVPYLRHIGTLKKEVILSTGMSDLAEIKFAIDTLRHAGTPINLISLLHCTTQYPTPYNDVNLNAIKTLQTVFPEVKSIGYSDHTLGIDVPIAAVSIGANIIEKHFTIDKNMEGPDHKASLSPTQLKDMIKSIRNIELALGNGEKAPRPSEIDNIKIARKSIVAEHDIKKGETFSANNLAVKRPFTGISPIEWDNVIGQKAKRDFKADEPIEL